MSIVAQNITLPVVRGFFGPRVATYSTSLSVQDIRHLLRHDPRSANWKALPLAYQKMYATVQRKTNAKRLVGIKDYIDARFVSENAIAGAFPAVSLAISEYCAFEGIDQDDEQLIGILRIALSAHGRSMIIDGLGRITAALDILDEVNDAGDNPRRSEAALKRLNSFQFPCTIFTARAPGQTLTTEDFQQLFHDFNYLATPIGKDHAINLDHSNIHVSVARRLGEIDVIKKNGGMKLRMPEVEARGRKPVNKKKSEAPLISLAEMIVFVRTATEGQECGIKPFREAPIDPVLSVTNADGFTRDLARFLEIISTEMGSAWKEKSSLHRTIKGWFAIASAFHHYRFGKQVGNIDMDDVARAIGRVDWSYMNPIWGKVLRVLDHPVCKASPYKFLETGHKPKRDTATALIETVDDSFATRAPVEDPGARAC